MKIVVVEDDPVVRELIEFKLSSAGHEVLLEADGEAGLNTVKTARPDLVILDWMMPKLTGLEVCEAIRADAEISDMSVLLLTARAQESDVEKGFAAGVNDYLLKPFSPRELLSRVEALAAKKK
ncbi:MAG TPA: response regulator [Acidimicrobiales bacterium]|nr:response regulator [Acidimicrobiales bacterium]